MSDLPASYFAWQYMQVISNTMDEFQFSKSDYENQTKLENQSSSMDLLNFSLWHD